ncbi:MAG TPA: hypothetical protein VFN60_05540, partial [Acidimicrobiales bacterium]|nr:hypothetical protein [Acidimicrobiales bacterium]
DAPTPRPPPMSRYHLVRPHRLLDVVSGDLADFVDEVRKVVRRVLHAGADFVKVIATGAVMTTGGVPDAPEFSESELRAAVDGAALYGGGSASPGR